jgi:polyisoprenoid-binding protein YceI
MTRILCLVLLGCAATMAGAADAPTRYTQASGSTLRFEFMQLGAAATGSFGQFGTELTYDERALATSSLRVVVQMTSLDTQDAERDGVLRDTDLFDVQKHPTATFVSSSLTRTATGLEALGKLTLRGVSRDVRLPLVLKPTATGLELSGQTVLRRLEFGVGQGDWKSTESIGDEVKVQYRVLLVKAR